MKEKKAVTCQTSWERKKIVRIVWTVFAKTEKVQKWSFFIIFGLILAMFLTSHSGDIDAIAHIGL